jgi:hypothetical protein
MRRTPRRESRPARSIPAPPEKESPRLPILSADGLLSFQVELLAHITHELPRLIVAHRDELEPNGFPLDIDWKSWLDANALGRLICFTARADKVLIGYIGTQLFRSVISKGKVIASIEHYWLDPGWRFGWAPVEFFRENQKVLDEIGADITYITAEMGYQNGRARSIFKRLGFKLKSELWTRIE